MKLSLAKKALLLWRIWLMLICAAAGVLFYALFPLLGNGAVAAGIFLGAIALWLFFFWIPGYHSSFQIQLEAGRLSLHRGVFLHLEHSTSLSAVLLLQLHQTPLQRLMGIASVTLCLPGSRLHLPDLSLDDAQQLLHLWKTYRRRP